MKFLIVLVFYLISFSEAMQSELEEVTLDGIYNFFSDDFTTKKFYVQIVVQVRKICHSLESSSVQKNQITVDREEQSKKEAMK